MRPGPSTDPDTPGGEAEKVAGVVRAGVGRDFDWLVIGSGFGGSVAALRLAEKGYRVGILECGKRFADDDFAKSAWRLRRYFWMPRFGLRGIFRLTAFKDIFIVSGNGVGGGSLGYANTLYRAQPAFFTNPQWAGLAEWDSELRPHYDTAERMLGVADYEGATPADALLKAYGEQIGVGETYKQTRVGIFFGEAGEQVEDPYFGGDGPARTGCVRCAGCMIGCRYGGAWLRKRRRTFTAGGVVVAAGALGTNQLLARCKHGGALPMISPNRWRFRRASIPTPTPTSRLSPTGETVTRSAACSRR